jgi:uncharacterized protein (DUF362 family)
MVITDFVHILKLYSSPADRTLLDFTTLYRERTKLYNFIDKLISSSLTENHVKGKKVFFKPNWVKHPKKEIDEWCLITNENFILAALEYILKRDPKSVLIADAPIQGCKWENLLSLYFFDQINNLSKKYNVPILIKDLRRRKYIVSENKPTEDIKPLSDYIIFDLDKDSLLEPITLQGKTRFRVTSYNPEKMALAHSPGVHKYCIAKDFFDADIFISLPKIKTHQKTGITGALKNLVGINGDKDFLPHHRLGGTNRGGDCYPGGSLFRYWSELLLDEANLKQGRKSFWYWQKLSSLLWFFSLPGKEHRLDAGWYGNDTTWRMVADINHIALYGKPDGTISDIKQREIYSLCDGIIAGQGDGPLEPEPLPLGIISFTNNALANDRLMAILMSLPVNKIPLLNINNLYENSGCEYILNGKVVSLEEIKQYAVKATPPEGWLNYLKNGQ